VLAKIKRGNEMIDKDAVERLIVQSGAVVGVTHITDTDHDMTHFTPEELKDFTDAIAAHQREQSASIFDAEPSEMWMARDVAEAIRKQGETK